MDEKRKSSRSYNETESARDGYEKELSQYGSEMDNNLQPVITLDNIVLAPSLSVKYSQLAELIERIVNNVLHEKIEKMLAEVVEKVVTTEIDNLKKNMLENSDYT
jgi:hypothetical protein